MLDASTVDSRKKTFKYRAEHFLHSILLKSTWPLVYPARVVPLTWRIQHNSFPFRCLTSHRSNEEEFIQRYEEVEEAEWLNKENNAKDMSNLLVRAKHIFPLNIFNFKFTLLNSICRIFENEFKNTHIDVGLSNRISFSNSTFVSSFLDLC